ncbi:rhomboid family intramembrane serine protease [Paracoccus ravus]|uniref:rhomboid family intramembrane serine protease n=1 Tax=Paracoccus ravus TaxID=2447760 RepID=UPI00106E3076|nr:rhomboid family intramembrane serine protease [Paracoccus ravus]
MFPIRDHNPSLTTPYVRNGLIFLNVVLYLLTDPMLGGMTELWDRLALYPAAVMHGEHEWGFLTHMFLHAGLIHLGGNMLFLWVFGDNLEDQMGHIGFLIYYLACGFAAAAGQVWAAQESTIPMVGASGAIAGVMGGYLLLFPKAKVDVIAIIIIIIKRFTIPAWVLLLAWFGLQLFSTAMGQDDGVAYMAHAAGFIGGILLAVPVFLRRGGPEFWKLTQGRPLYQPINYTPSRIPEVRR